MFWISIHSSWLLIPRISFSTAKNIIILIRVRNVDLIIVKIQRAIIDTIVIEVINIIKLSNILVILLSIKKYT